MIKLKFVLPIKVRFLFFQIFSIFPIFRSFSSKLNYQLWCCHRRTRHLEGLEGPIEIERSVGCVFPLAEPPDFGFKKYKWPIDSVSLRKIVLLSAYMVDLISWFPSVIPWMRL